MGKRQRIAYIDIAKGIGIWLMVLGHQNISELTRTYIYSFHMPLFFLISGMFFSKGMTVRQTLRSSVRTLLIPYLAFSLINLSVCWISPRLHPELYYDLKGKAVFLAALKGMLIGTDHITPTSFMPLGVLWFIVALFIIRVACGLLGRLIKNDGLFTLFSACLALSLFLLVESNALFSFRSAMMAMPFYLLGHTLRSVDFRTIPYRGLLLSVCVAYFILVVPKNGFCTIDECIYGGSLVVFYLNGMTGSLMLLLAASFINSCRAIEYAGRNTLVVMGMHPFCSIPLKVVCVYLWGSDVLCSPYYLIVAPVIITIGSLMLSVPINRYCPAIVGKFL